VDARFCMLIAVAGLMHGSAAMAGPAITLFFEERAPYVVRNGDGVEGLTASPAAQAFKAADVAFVWEVGSMSRQMHMLRENQGPHCMVGWFKTSERMTYAKFTKPIYRDGPIVALARREFSFGPGRTVAEALSLPGVRVLVRGKYSYGSYIDAALRRIQPALVASPLPNVQLIDLLMGNRADFMFASEEESINLLRRAANRANNLQVMRFSDVLPGVERHIACTRSVPDEIIGRLNRAITFK
jgi:polar amino acid transport system substrate-binding protein